MNLDEFNSASYRDDFKSNNNAHFFSILFSNKLAFLLFKINLSPNQVTFLFLLAGICSSISVYFSLPILSYVLWRLHIILDMADGDIARATKKFSKSAMGFDRTNHIIINTSMIIALSFPTQNIFLINIILVSFYLNYFFSRNYYSSKQQTRHFSIIKNILKSIIGLEGFILFSIILIIFSYEVFQEHLMICYSIFFIALYFYKLNIFIKDNQTNEEN